MRGEIHVNVNFVIGIMSAAPIKRTHDDRINKKAIDLHVELNAIELVDLLWLVFQISNLDTAWRVCLVCDAELFVRGLGCEHKSLVVARFYVLCGCFYICSNFGSQKSSLEQEWCGLRISGRRLNFLRCHAYRKRFHRWLRR